MVSSIRNWSIRLIIGCLKLAKEIYTRTVCTIFLVCVQFARTRSIFPMAGTSAVSTRTETRSVGMAFGGISDFSRGQGRPERDTRALPRPFGRRRRRRPRAYPESAAPRTSRVPAADFVLHHFISSSAQKINAFFFAIEINYLCCHSRTARSRDRARTEIPVTYRWDTRLCVTFFFLFDINSDVIIGPVIKMSRICEDLGAGEVSLLEHCEKKKKAGEGPGANGRAGPRQSRVATFPA